jgi:hypothetical protein
MAEDPSNGMTWLLEIGQQHLDHLGPIRHWGQLKIAASPGVYWVAGLTSDQLMAPAIKSIPFKSIYYTAGQRLFPQGGFVPVKKLPLDLVWMPLEKGLPLTLPSFNHNYFGIPEKINIRLAASRKEEEAVALLTSKRLLADYILSAPAVRLTSLRWVIVDDEVLILGKPLLPLPGESYWERGDFLLPVGLDLEWPALAEMLNRELNPDGDKRLVWDRDSRYWVIAKEQFAPLSISSFRLTMAGLT